MKHKLLTFLSIVSCMFCFSEAVLAASYSVNLMWIHHADSWDTAPPGTLFGNDKNTVSTFVNTIADWSNKNPEAEVTVWYDGKFVTNDAVETTSKWITTVAPNQVVLKDIRTLKRVQAHLDVFADTTPTYFRADLLRIIATLETVWNAEPDYSFVYADMDVTPMSKDALFDEETQKNLNQYGIVVKRGGIRDNMENSFHIVSNQNKNLLKALDIALVETNIQRAYNAISNDFSSKYAPKGEKFPRKYPFYLEGKDGKDTQELGQIVYESYPLMWRLFYSLEGLGNLNILRDKTKKLGETYNYEKHHLDPFGLHGIPCYYAYEEGFLYFEHTKNTPGGEYSLTIPTKKVDAPPSKGSNYY